MTRQNVLNSINASMVGDLLAFVTITAGVILLIGGLFLIITDAFLPIGVSGIECMLFAILFP